MTIMLDCSCGRKLVVDDEHAGRQGHCPACGRIVDIPDPNQPHQSLEPLAREGVTPGPPQAPAEVWPEDREVWGPTPLWLPAAEDRPITKRRWRPGRVVLGVVALAVIVFLAVRFGGGLLRPRLGEKLAFTDKEEIYYKNVPVDEARRLGQALKEFGYFKGISRSTVQLYREDDHYVIAFVVREGTWHNRDAVDIMWLVGLKLSARVFNSQPVEVRLCDMYMREKKSLKPGDADLGKWLAVSPREDIYYRDITEVEARNLGEQLKQMQVFDGKADRTVLVAQDSTGVTFTFPVQDGHWNNPDTVDGLRLTGLELAARVFDGRPVEVRLCNHDLTETKALKRANEGLGKWLAVSAREDVYYRGVSEAEARQLGALLQRSRYFDGKTGGLVAVARDAEGVKLTIPVQEGAWNDPGAIRDCQALGQQIRLEVFGNAATEVRLADGHLRVKKTLPIR
jgi:hypothetical protein